MTDVYLRVAGQGPYLIAENVSEETADIIEYRSVWPVTRKESACVECAEGKQTGTENSARPAETSLTPAGEYSAWLQLPAVGGKVPWSLVARGIEPTETEAFLGCTVRRMSVQPS